mmetsp:Transcript_7695/g.28347  ORF Transcript_7695/g.28347 Transcript_7695/m.28347 type:complete len:215 (-) Transcript_7695:1469-2113(-)
MSLRAQSWSPMERYVGDMWPKSFSARMTYLASFSVKLAMCLLEASVSAKSMCRVWNSAIEGMPKRLRRSMLAWSDRARNLAEGTTAATPCALYSASIPAVWKRTCEWVAMARSPRRLTRRVRSCQWWSPIFSIKAPFSMSSVTWRSMAPPSTGIRSMRMKFSSASNTTTAPLPLSTGLFLRTRRMRSASSSSCCWLTQPAGNLEHSRSWSKNSS